MSSKASVFVLVVSLVSAVLPTRSQELVLGWEGDSQRGYGFVNPVGVLRDSDTSNVLLVVRGSLNYLYYSVPEDGGTTRVVSPAFSAGAGWRFVWPGFSMTLSSDFEVRRTERTFSGGEPVRVIERGFLIQGNVFCNVAAFTNVHLLASYGAANQYLWTRFGVKQQVTNTSFVDPSALALGIELTAQGNRDVHSYSAGGFMEFMFLDIGASLQLRSGYSLLQNQGRIFDRALFVGAGVYVGL